METMNQEELRKQMPKATLAINEIFYSIQGEGKYAGTPMVFIRFNLCSVGCSFCDTAYTWRKVSHNKFLECQEVLLKIKELAPKCKICCITGGEPLEQADNLLLLCSILAADGYKIHLETSGSVIIPEDLKKYVFWMVCSPKKFNGLNYAAKIDEVKILVKKNHTVDRIRNFVNKFRKGIYVSIQPIEPKPYSYGNFDGLSEEEKLLHKEEIKKARELEQIEWQENCKTAVDLCLQTGWHISLQQHKQLFIR
jgi:organic radical activating enzyme